MHNEYTTYLLWGSRTRKVVKVGVINPFFDLGPTMKNFLCYSNVPPPYTCELKNAVSFDIAVLCTFGENPVK